jgi:hypothetical protein
MAVVATGTTVFLRYTGAQQPGRAGLQPDVPGHDAGLLPVVQMGHDFAVDEAARHVAEHLVVFTENGSHCFSSRFDFLCRLSGR